MNPVIQTIAKVLVLVSVDGAPAEAVDVRARIDQDVVLHAAVELAAGKNGQCTWITEAPAVRGRCRTMSPEAGAKLRWFKIEADEKAYNNVPDGAFKLASIAWVENEWQKDVWSVPADVRPLERAGIGQKA